MAKFEAKVHIIQGKGVVKPGEIIDIRTKANAKVLLEKGRIAEIKKGKDTKEQEKTDEEQILDELIREEEEGQEEEGQE
ncbi:hypothetical protein BpsM61_00052 [Bacillus phage vB_BpsM-61]|nr:hypothetical protein BpsM61_00052 [Bacillus phage vB_BpsM-61]